MTATCRMLVLLSLALATVVSVSGNGEGADGEPRPKPSFMEGLRRTIDSSSAWLKRKADELEVMLAENKEELDEMVKKTMHRLQEAQSSNMLSEDMKEKMKGMMADLEEFKNTVESSTDDQFAKLEKQWEEKVKPIYGDGGPLDVQRLRPLSSSAPQSGHLALPAVMACVLACLFA